MLSSQGRSRDLGTEQKHHRAGKSPGHIRNQPGGFAKSSDLYRILVRDSFGTESNYCCADPKPRDQSCQPQQARQQAKVANPDRADENRPQWAAADQPQPLRLSLHLRMPVARRTDFTILPL